MKKRSILAGNDLVNRFIGDTAYDTVKAVSDNIVSVATVGNNIANVNTVAGIAIDVSSLAGIRAAIESLYADKVTLDSLYADKAVLDSLFADKIKLDSLYTDKATLDSLYADKAKIDQVFADRLVINDVGSDPLRTEILAAGSNAGTATTKATEAAASATASETSRQASDAALYDFKGRYFQALAIAPTVDLNGNPLNAGDMYFDTTLNEMRVYNGTLWKSAGSTVSGTSQRQSFTATVGQTIFTIAGGYDPTFADVYINGRKLLNGVDVDVSSGVDIVLTVGASAGDIVDVVAYGAFEIANTYTKAEIDAGTVVLNGIKNVDGVGSGLDADTVDGVQGALLGVGGAGYAWVDETANRAAGVTYTNTTGKPIMINVGYSSSNSSCYFVLYIDGVLIRAFGDSTLSGVDGRLASISSIIPAGSIYKISSGSASTTPVEPAVGKWFELK